MLDIKKVVVEIAKGDVAAEEFCAVMFYFIHTQDDLFDKDKEVSAIELARMNYYLISMLADNRFFQKHKATLLPVIYASSMAWAASEGFVKNESPLYKLAAQVLKSQYQDIFLITAYLVGGQAHYEAMSAKYRDYNFDKS